MVQAQNSSYILPLLSINLLFSKKNAILNLKKPSENYQYYIYVYDIKVYK